ncbi:spore coat protein CotJB [Clostridium estertheticum]|uniref:Spore coat protein CotJB n=1 Tax=Clostridium estertheticum TaxID=238834 RepID=A0A7Y3STY4_9CLOT|nr:spore coat protein CotJB [Clostridium estertheticum]MBU3155961.1 spore coat protein CotJB [Clostridium estertheticum]MBU3177896.1 spore coat protein CotJB [Clostridium estertheticum]MBU3200574.1 spore coat protein CotJB [Clostridium estertheticum]MBX4264872.1 spore coat protein CotJB [Clostridium estertheticum]MCB2308566.1 spore coat protein CotJB [Clostridium estertheticum]
MESKMELLKQIVAGEFIKEDLALYLNTHPMDQEALAKYNFYVVETKGLKDHYEMNYGMLSEHDSLSPYPWRWSSNPWPWEPEANFSLRKEDK